MKQRTERWKPVHNYENLYLISSHGRVRCIQTLELLKQQTISTGYKRVRLSKGNQKKSFLVHRLMGFAFKPNPQNKPFIDHINGIRDCNYDWNIRWCTHAENMRYKAEAKKTGMSIPVYKKSGPVDSPGSWPVVQLSLTGELIESFPTLNQAAKKSGVIAASIFLCLKGRSSHVGGFRWQFPNQAV